MPQFHRTAQHEFYAFLYVVINRQPPGTQGGKKNRVEQIKLMVMAKKKMGSSIPVFILILLLSLSAWSCHRGPVDNGNDTIDSTELIGSPSLPSPQDIKVNIYIENSGSMDGFVEKGTTDFKDDVYNLLVDIENWYDPNDEGSVHLYFINNDCKEKLQVFDASSGKEIADFATWIGVNWKKQMLNRGSNTNINNIFSSILQRTDEQTISILISDCIYSIGNGKTMEQLGIAKAGTKDAFLKGCKRGERDLATSIYRMTSAFDGSYYPYTGDANKFLYRGDLPYYICVFANNDVMNDFCSKVTISEKDYKGYKNRYTISHSSTEEPYWTILPLTKKKGRFQKIREENCVDKVHGIDNVERDRYGVLSFCVAVDMSGVNVQEDYLLNPANYILDNTRYTIASITPFNKEEINPSDLIMLQKGSQMPTHILTIEATGTAICDLGISLERKMPQWIDTFNIMDDTSKEKLENKGNVGSFGLRYWIEGISRAYETLYPGDNEYFNLKITIKK